MSTLVVGDLHLKQTTILPLVDSAIEKNPSIQHVIFLGDACDDWGADEKLALKELGFYADWVESHREAGLRIDVLLGNHDFCYIRGRRGPGTLMGIRRQVKDILVKRLDAQIATVANDVFLCLHAGLTHLWALRHLSQTSYVSKTSKESASLFESLQRNANAYATELNNQLGNIAFHEGLDSCPPSRGGWEIPGPLWADLSDLERDPAKGVWQIVGHTPVHTVYVCGDEQSPAEAQLDRPVLIACDTLSTTAYGSPIGDGSALLIEGNDVTRVFLRD
ncbi:hypothetical protein DMP07_03045 [Slackia faecicanis]|uniref:Calcineurin-like phosphoesterase domain-containing protein n=2 Tax=Slackia faecicanis TaxID=255723 RepID=A0A3N0AFR7_9ACTN|nr:hypothetical protein DMP07_03045 [Slackia faecicanis]